MFASDYRTSGGSWKDFLPNEVPTETAQQVPEVSPGLENLGTCFPEDCPRGP